MLDLISALNKRITEMMNYTEKALSEYLDDLLVKAGIEQKRSKFPVSAADEYANNFFNFKQSPRIQVIFGIKDKKQDCLVITYKNTSCDFSMVNGEPLAKTVPATIRKITSCIKQLLKDKRDDIIDGYREALEISAVNFQHKKTNSDGPVCDSLFAEKGHLFGERKRPWLEKINREDTK